MPETQTLAGTKFCEICEFEPATCFFPVGGLCEECQKLLVQALRENQKPKAEGAD